MYERLNFIIVNNIIILFSEVQYFVLWGKFKMAYLLMWERRINVAQIKTWVSSIQNIAKTNEKKVSIKQIHLFLELSSLNVFCFYKIH